MKEEYTRWDEFKGKIENLPGCVTIFIFVLVTLLLFSFVHALWYNCGKIDKDELLIEKIELSNKSHIYLVHSWKCKDKCIDKNTGNSKMQWFEKIEDVVDFIKYKYYVYDNCIDVEHATALNAISNANISDFDRYYLFSDYSDGYYEHRNLYDTSERAYSILYSVIGDSLISLPKEYQGTKFITNKKKFFKGE